MIDSAVKCLKPFVLVLLLLLLCASARAEDVRVKTRPVVETKLYDEARARAEARQRIEAGIYDRNGIDLCDDDKKPCGGGAFEPFKQTRDGKTVYSVEIHARDWSELKEEKKKGKQEWSQIPAEVQDRVIAQIIENTWGGGSRKYPPLDVTIVADGSSPLDHLSPHARDMYLKFNKPEYIKVGVGGDAYGPNCWYTSLSTVSDKDSSYAHSRGLTGGSWSKHRQMGPSEFRWHMREFEQVEHPEFGDIVRYYTDDEVNWGPFGNGESHGAIYIGREDYTGPDGKPAVREIILSKDGHDDLDFYHFCDIRSTDEAYLDKLEADNPLLKKYGKDPRKRGFFRVKKGAAIFDPAVDKYASHAYGAYLIDQVNYKDRWDCIRGDIKPPPGKDTSAYSYPLRWLTVKYADELPTTAPMPATAVAPTGAAVPRANGK